VTRQCVPAAADDRQRTHNQANTSGFAGLGLDPSLLRALAERGVHTPFAIQTAALPDALAGRDILGRARTGSGKTLAFGLALITRLTGCRAQPFRPLGLVLTPTRELAQQVSDALRPYATLFGLRCTTVVGGLSIRSQTDALRRGSEIVVATPGRLSDLMDRDACRLDHVAVTVLDEADRMADMGFLPQVIALLDRVPRKGQRMLFSATLDHDVDRLVRRYLVDPVAHSVDPGAATVTTMAHHVLHVDPADKHAAISQIAARDGRVLMFLATRRRAERLVRDLLAVGVRAAALHGGRTQPQRSRALEQFRTGAVTALIATDVAARGIDIDDMDLVVNIDPPADAKDYLHRGGRTARAGKAGTVVTLVLPTQHREVSRLIFAAGIVAEPVRVRPGHPELIRITGARPPTDLPVTVRPVAEARVGAVPSATPRRRPTRRPTGRHGRAA
jgi:superfamily II DNA/RNA helicase